MKVPKKNTAGDEGSAVAKAAAELRRLALTKGDGAFLGSEDDMVEQLRVSRPTLRQASAQVLQENLISVRRGVGGGYFARLPDSTTVSRMAAIFLQSRDVNLPKVLQSIKPIRTEIAGLAAHHEDASFVNPLREFIEREEVDLAEHASQTYRAFLRSEGEFGKIIGLLAGNPVLALFLSILYDLVPMLRRDEDVLVNHPERVEAYRRQRIQMARAVLDRDEEIARVASRRCSDLIIEWMGLDPNINDARLPFPGLQLRAATPAKRTGINRTRKPAAPEPEAQAAAEAPKRKRSNVGRIKPPAA